MKIAITEVSPAYRASGSEEDFVIRGRGLDRLTNFHAYLAIANYSPKAKSAATSVVSRTPEEIVVRFRSASFPACFVGLVEATDFEWVNTSRPLP